MYCSLEPDKIIKTLVSLEQRISLRFPASGLARVCAELVSLARDTQARTGTIAKSNPFVRSGSWLAILAGLALLVALGTSIVTSTKTSDDLYGTLQGIDAAFNLLVLLGAALFFLITLENRLKQRQALMALHEFRSIVHVIDMHQLTKDPSMLGAVRTSASPERSLTPFELVRYLDYCSEMLSLAAKCAALYAEKLSDPVVIDTVGDIERLASELSNKIWQKITIVQNLDLDGGRVSPLPIPPPPRPSPAT